MFLSWRRRVREASNDLGSISSLAGAAVAVAVAATRRSLFFVHCSSSGGGSGGHRYWYWSCGGFHGCHGWGAVGVSLWMVIVVRKRRRLESRGAGRFVGNGAEFREQRCFVVIHNDAVAARGVVPTVPYRTLQNESVGVACFYKCDNKRRRK